MTKHIISSVLLLIISALLFTGCSDNKTVSHNNTIKQMVDSVMYHAEEYGKDTAYFELLNKADSALTLYSNNNPVDSFYINSTYVLTLEKAESNPKEALDELYRLSVYAKEMGLIKEYGFILSSRAKILYKYGLYNKAIPLFIESATIIKENSTKNDDLNAYAYALMDIGNIYSDQIAYDMAKDYYDMSKAEIIKFKDTNDKYYGLAVYENNIALLKLRVNNNIEAETHLRKALYYRKLANKENLYSHSYYYLARLKLELDQKDSAMYYFKKSMLSDSSLNLVNERIKSTRIYAYYLAHIAKKPEKSFHYYQEVLLLTKKYKIEESLAIINLGIGGYYYRKNQYDSAIYYGWRADSIATLHGQTHTLGSSLRFLQGIFTKQNDYKNLNKVLLEMMAMQKDKNKNDEITKFQISYEYEQKQEEKTLRVDDRKRHRIINILIGAIAALCLLYAALLVFGRKKINKQSKRLEKSLQAEKRLKLFQQDMTNMIIHDLKNPLSTIINVKFLAEDEQGLNLVQQSGYQMNTLVMNILDVYKYDNARINLNKTEINIYDIYKSAFSQVEFLANSQNINIIYDKNINCIMNLDKEVITRVLVNLLSNAIKYSPSNSDVKINLQKQNNSEIKISVINSGSHIPKEFQEQIFERFVHSKDNSETEIRSTGLGLTFCKIAVEGHNGKIGVNSEPNTDVEFWFTLSGLVKFNETK